MSSEVQVINRKSALPSRVLRGKAAFMLVVVRCCILVFPFHRLRRGLIRIFGRPKRVGMYSPKEIARAVARMTRYVPRATCLVAALACELILLRHGHEPEMHVGVLLTQDHDLEAHAWLDCDGKTILGEEVNTANFRRLSETGE